MDRCYISESGYSISLLYPLRDATHPVVVPVFAQFFTICSQVIQPIAADVWLETAKYEPLIEHYLTKKELPPTQQAWHIREDPAPMKITAQSGRDDGEPIIKASRLTPALLTDWVRQAITQPSPGPDLLIIPEYMPVFYTRVRLASERDQRTLAVYNAPRGQRIDDIPVERFEEGMWVSTPTDKTEYAAIEMFLSNYWDTGFKAEFTIHWSWWFQPGQPEYAMLETMLHELVTQGWQLQATPQFEGHAIFTLK